MNQVARSGEKFGFDLRGGNSGKPAKYQPSERAHPWAPPATKPQDKRRSALLEYVLVTVAFLAIVLAIVVFARALQAHHSADNAAGGTTRYAMARGSD